MQKVETSSLQAIIEELRNLFHINCRDEIVVPITLPGPRPQSEEPILISWARCPQDFEGLGS